MAGMNCPSCNAKMEKITEPDITTDVCQNCSAIFLDKGELNALATALAGDIEYCSIDRDRHGDRFPTRTCPKCPDQQMIKVNLLAFSSVIFDFCPTCEGFFLDKGEVEAMNRDVLDFAAVEAADEFRGYVDDHLVRINRIGDVKTFASVGMMGTPVGVPVEYVEIAVYFKNPLHLGLKISQEKWTAKVAKVLGLSKAQDIVTGDAEFDGVFVVQGQNEGHVKRVLSDNVRGAILGFVRKKPSIFSERGSLEVLDNRAMYREGPYSGQIKADLQKKASGIIADLVDLARVIESV